MHFQSEVTSHLYGGYIAGYNGADTTFLGLLQYLGRGINIFVVQHGVQRQVYLYAGLAACVGDAAQVVRGEVDARTGTHIQRSQTEVYRIGAGVNGGM